MSNVILLKMEGDKRASRFVIKKRPSEEHLLSESELSDPAQSPRDSKKALVKFSENELTYNNTVHDGIGTEYRKLIKQKLQSQLGFLDFTHFGTFYKHLFFSVTLGDISACVSRAYNNK